MVEIKKMRCERCKKLMYISDIRITDKDGIKVPMCKLCLSQSEMKKREQRVPSDDPSKVPYMCARCKYKFRTNPLKGKLACPYCGKADKVMELKEIDPARLIEEAN